MNSLALKLSDSCPINPGMRLNPKILPIFLVLAPLGACAGKSDNNTKTADNGKENQDKSKNDDLSESEPVPMALFGGEMIAQSKTALGSAASPSTSAIKRDGSDTSGQNPSTTYASAIIATPGNAASEMLDVLSSVNSIQQAVFTNFFGDKTVTVKVDATTGKGNRLYKLPNPASGQPTYADVVYNGKDAVYPNEVDLYGPTAAGNLELQMSVQVAPDAADTSKAQSVHIYYAGAVGSDASRTMADITYEVGSSTLSVSFGPSPIVSAYVPAKTIMKMTTGPETDFLKLYGAYTWQRDSAAPADVLAPAYTLLNSGDIEGFRAYARTSNDMPMVQQLAFMPKSELATITTSPSVSVFQTNEYSTYTMAFLSNLVRLQSVNAGCSTTGETIRQAFGTKTQPASVASLPNNVCKTTTTQDATDTKVSQAIADTCDAGISLLVAVTLSNQTTTNYSLCDKYAEEASPLVNPQFIHLDTASNSRVQVLAANATDAMNSLKSTMDQDSSYLKLDDLATLTWPALPTKTSDDVASAETQP